MNAYATLAQIRAYLKASGTDMASQDDPKLFQYLIWASRQIDRRAHRKFYPRSEERKYDFQDDLVVLYLDDDLVSLSTLTVDGSEISSDYYYLYPLNEYPKNRIEMKKGDAEQFTYTDTPQDAVQVDGIWCFHDDWDNAWPDSQDTVQDDPLTAAATTLTVSDVDGPDINGLTPRFAVGDTLKIGSEYLFVTGDNEANNTLTVRRGMNGTTAAQQSNATTIYRFNPYTAATMATLDLTKWIYEHRHEAGGIIALPSLEGTAIKAKVDEILEPHMIPVRPPRVRI